MKKVRVLKLKTFKCSRCGKKTQAKHKCRYCDKCRAAVKAEYQKEYGSTRTSTRNNQSQYLKDLEQSHLKSQEFWKFFTEKIAYD